MNNSQVRLAQDWTFAQRMTECRQPLGMSQAALAEALATRGMPCHQQTVARIENGVRYVHVGEACAIADVLGVDLASMAGLAPLPSLDLPGRIAELERAAAAAQDILSEVLS